jgi:hypothetical protein
MALILVIYGIFLQKMHQVIKIACKIICENELCRYFVQYEGGNGGGVPILKHEK